MTINLTDNVPRQSYTVTAGQTQTTFSVPFEFFAIGDLNVYVDGVKKTNQTHYTLASGGNGSTGTINLTVTGITGNSTVVITRDIPLERTTDFQTSGPFAISSLNIELDKIIAIQADLEDEIARSLRLTDFDVAANLTLPELNSRKGTTLAFNATTGAVEAGPSVAGVTTVAALSADIAALADIEDGTIATDAISGLAAIKTDVTAVSNIATAVSAVNSNATNINAVNSNSSNINTVAGKSSEITSVAAKASLLTSDFVSDLNTLAVTDVINDINLLATSDIVSDLNTLATTDIVSDLNTLATTDIVSDINSLATSDIVTDLNLLATSDFVSDLNTLATSGNVTALNTVSGAIANVNTAATSISEITSFNDLFSVGSSAPSSPSSGDLWYDTTNSQLKVYVGSSFQTAGAYLQGLTSTHVFTATNNQTTFTTDDASQTMSIYANGNTLVFKNGIRLVEGANGSTNDYHISGNNVVLNAGATTGDILYVEVFTKISTTQETSLNALVTSATTQANTATTQASTATTQATAATTAKTAAETAQTASETAKTASETAKTASETAQAAAEAALDSFDDRYLGAKSSAPSTDNDGNALVTGAIYWNSTSDTLQVWDGSAFQQGAFTAGSLLANIVEDTTPVLGGSLDVGTNSIVSVSNRDIAITPNGSGSVVLDGLNYPQADGSNGQFLKTDGSGQLSFGTVSTPSLSSLGIANHDNLSVDGSGNVALGSSSIAFGSSKWTIVLDGNDLDFQYNGSTVFKLASSGAVTSADNITAYGSP